MTKSEMKKLCKDCDQNANGWCSKHRTNSIEDKIELCGNKLYSTEPTNGKFDKFLDSIEEGVNEGSMLNCFQIGITLKVIEDRMWDIDSKIAQRCNDLQHRIFNK